MVPVSPKLFAQVAHWATENKVEITSNDAESWHDAPNSGWLYGSSAIDGGGDKYNRIGKTVFARFLAETGVTVVESSVFSDRTGEHRCVRLQGEREEYLLSWAKGMARQRVPRTAYVLPDGSTHEQIPAEYHGPVYAATATIEGTVTVEIIER